jgi:hypothetical protein
MRNAVAAVLLASAVLASAEPGSPAKRVPDLQGIWTGGTLTRSTIRQSTRARGNRDPLTKDDQYRHV